MFDSCILHNGAFVAVVCLALAGACSGEDTGDGSTPAAAAGAGGSGSSSGGGAGTTGFTNEAAGTGGAAGMGGSAAVAATGGRPGVVGSSGAAGVAGAAGAAGVAGAAGAGGSDGEGGAAGSDGSEGDAVVNYTSEAQPILQANCSPCHSGLGLGGHNAAAVYDDAVRVAENMLDEIESGDMPPACDGDDPGDPNCVSEEDLEVLEQWVDDDTPE